MTSQRAIGTSPAEFVIHTDRRATNRWHGGIIAMHAILAVILVVAILIVSDLTAERDMSGAPESLSASHSPSPQAASP